MISFGMTPADRAEVTERLDQVHDALSAGGRTLMPLSEYPFAPRYAWVEDTYGVSWQLIMRECEPAESGTLTVLPALMFCGAAQNRCAAATDHYISTFPDSRVITRVTYPRAAGPATTDSVMFSELELAGQRITAMDSGVEQDFTFTEGASLIVNASSQDQLDEWWQALSQHPEAEQCGWAKDAFGLSWQIVPANLPDLMREPGAYQALMQMGKIDIDQLRAGN